MSALAPNAATARLLKRIEWTNILLVAALIVLVASLHGTDRFFYGVIAGGLLGMLNWRSVCWLAGRIMNASQRSSRFYVAVAGSKMVLLMTTIYCVAAYLPVTPLGLLVGLSTLVVAIFGQTLWRQLEPQNCEGSFG